MHDLPDPPGEDHRRTSELWLHETRAKVREVRMANEAKRHYATYRGDLLRAFQQLHDENPDMLDWYAGLENLIELHEEHLKHHYTLERLESNIRVVCLTLLVLGVSWLLADIFFL